MRLIGPLLFIILCISCAAGHLSADLKEGQAFRLYRSSLKKESNLKIFHNADSSYVLLIQPPDVMQGNNCSFAVLDLHERSLIFQSINRYRDAEWYDRTTLKLKKNTGYIRPDAEPGKPGNTMLYEFLDLDTKELSENPNTNPEKL